ncbi:MAG: lysophospholipid acyltransferase family protein [Robiginitalea sp.]|jgi:KDO2-lipid IV(A) lauroyltransferase
MQRLVFLLSYPFLWGLSRLPFRLLYMVSDLVRFLVYRVIRYRRKVVRENLLLVFPEKTPEERKEIERKFYVHLCDMFLEMIKTMGTSQEELQRRFVYPSLEVLERFENQNRSIMLLYPHYASWEWTMTLDPHVRGKGYAIYQPIKNKYFDRWIRDVREKLGTTLIPTRETKNVVAQNKKSGQLATYAILSDQSPMAMKAKYWAPFMGTVVPMHIGPESLCKRLDLPAVYLRVRKLRRGYYEGSFVVLAENPSEVPDYEITDAFFKEVEKSVLEAPEYYFWTHKRWKHRDKVPSSQVASRKAGSDS